MDEKGLNQPAKKHSAEEFLAAERRNPARNEYVNGKILAKSGTGRWQNIIASNIAVAVGSRLSGNKSEMYVNGMRVRLRDSIISYPDVVIVSGEPGFTDANQDVLLNPTVVVDIYSSATNFADKALKIESYLGLESIRECLLVKVDEMRIEQYSRQNAKQWTYKIHNEREDVISLDSVNCKISLAEVYAQIKFRHAELSSTAVN